MAIKRAVVVGLDDYSKWPGMSNLSCCADDAQNVRYLLIHGFGFDPNDIILYPDSDATRIKILSGLKYMLSQSQAGDVAFFYFSGHGSRKPAIPKKADCDSVYETICCYDNENHISDWNLKDLAAKLYASSVNFTVMLDSCHSGGMHKTDSIQKCKTIRATSEMIQYFVKFVNTIIPCGITLEDFSSITNNISNKSDSGSGIIDLDEDSNKTLIKFSKSTLLSACKFNEYAYVGKNGVKNSIFTQSLIDLVNQSNYQKTYRDLIDILQKKVQEYMTKLYPGNKQTPQLRGQMNRMDENFLEGWTQSK